MEFKGCEIKLREHLMFHACDKSLQNLMVEYQTKVKRRRMKMLDLLSIEMI